jgi:hypothetical protein
VSFVEGEGLPNPWVPYHPSVLSSALCSCNATDCFSEVWHIAFSPWTIEDVNYIKNSCHLVLVFDVIWNIEPKLMIVMQGDINMVIPYCWVLSFERVRGKLFWEIVIQNHGGKKIIFQKNIYIFAAKIVDVCPLGQTTSVLTNLTTQLP